MTANTTPKVTMTVTLMTMTSEVVRRHPGSRWSRQEPSPTTETPESTRPRRDRDNTWRIRTLSVSTPASINNNLYSPNTW